MRLENIVFDCPDPAATADFWIAALRLTEGHRDADQVEARLSVPGGPWLDLCFQRVSHTPAAHGAGLPRPRLHLDLAADGDQEATVSRLGGLGAHRADIGQADVPWEVMRAPGGHLFCVMADEPRWAGTGPIADIPIDCHDPERDAAFWAELTGWTPTRVGSAPALRHPSGVGPHLSFWPEPAPKTGKNDLHLDVRPLEGDTREAAVERALAAGATPVTDDWAIGHPWTVLCDPSGNEFCILAESSGE